MMGAWLFPGRTLPREPVVRENLTWAHSVSPGSYAHALDGLYRVAREGERSKPFAWQRSGAASSQDPGEGPGEAKEGREWRAGPGGRPEGLGRAPNTPFLWQRV